ncbi:hypothetical protein SODALDRAFT_326716 [Sodiomyces alkalinus F11]|uniref:Protein YOP1 n=1 Tax=Sodiomyces alkalinus (strain CBS 110278 / VKM F-3762 / F11) TaxID=1314773 RepID=A0A3N2Q702_SODAK|nr:hypothetical protein SODALDRAFT_326716 [Sodiomyces alkalinus F11]ROT42561.1 hypothetical protein SODALDRAFT_326716 [Sodiomyces alkalinus F11]
MFGLVPHLLSSIAAFLFPVFASYKALKSSDPAQLTPWLMYWVVLSCGLLIESWLDWVLFWVPLYSYARLLFLLYLVLPQTQGARFLYESYVHPFLEDNETHIEQFIADAHDRLKAAGMSYLKQAIEFVKTNILGMPPSEPAPEQPPASAAPQSYTQSLLARFNVPTARTNAGASDLYNFLAGAVAAAASAANAATSSSGPTAAAAGAAAGARGDDASSGDTVSAATTTSGLNLSSFVPSNLTGAGEKVAFIATQRERLNAVLGALDREARALDREATVREDRDEDRHQDRDEGGLGVREEPRTRRPSSSSGGFGEMNRNRSESEFEKVEAESGAEDEDGGVRRRPAPSGGTGSWLPFGWRGAGDGGSGGGTPTGQDGRQGRSSGIDADL